MLREPSRERLSRAGTMARCARQECQSPASGMAAKSCRASPGSQWVCARGPGRVLGRCAPSASGGLSCSLGFSCWGRRDQLELQEAEGAGAVAAAAAWDGAIGSGKVTVALALAAMGQGQGNLPTKEGSGVGSPRAAPGAAGGVTQPRVAVPRWDTERSPGSQARGLAAQAARCLRKSLACSCATGMKEKRRGAGSALQAVCASPCVTWGHGLALLWRGACRTAGPQAHPGHGCEQRREQRLIGER